MQCKNCLFENPPGMKFCGDCGAELIATCPNCRASNPPHFKFCGECGHSLPRTEEIRTPTDLSLDERLAKIKPYLPTGLAEKILSQKDRIEGQRRQVTIMFIDMKGYTPLTERLGPEETFSLMDQVFEILIRTVQDFGGTVNEIRGDGILALFGAPIALEDAPQRAIRSSLEIHRGLIRFSEQIKNEKIPPVLVRIGINSGTVVVGTLGNDLRLQFTAVGDTINMAARMEQLAEPGTTYVTEETFKLTEGFFRFEALGERLIEGKKEAKKVYRVIAASTRKTRFDVSAERGLTRFIGRERELELLADAFQRVKEGRGQAVSIMGEAGVGKSRLLYEFRKAVTNEDISFLEGRCLSYGRGIAYQAITDMLKSTFGVEDEDADSAVTEKVQGELARIGIEEASTLPYFLELLSVQESGLDSFRISPQAIKDRMLGSVQRLVLKGSEEKPLVLAFEDLQWMDKNSEETAKHLLESVPGARVMMIFTYRPDFILTWGGRSFHSQITLNRLSNWESLAMVEHILGGEVASDLQELILEKTEGVPFFIEEFVRTIVDMAIIERPNQAYHLGKDIDRVAIPSTIQAVIMARMDALPEGARSILQIGSVIGREFSHELMLRATKLPDQEMLSYLAALKDSELLYERGIYPQSTYIFKHALTREVVYDSILTRRKKSLHEKVANTMEQLYSDNLDEYYAVLTEHFIASQNYVRAAEFAKLAGKKSKKTASLKDAIAFARKRVESLEKLPQTDQVLEQIIDARTALGLNLLQMTYMSEAKEAVDPIIETALKSGHKRRICQIFSIMGTYNSWVDEDFDSALQHLGKALEIAEEVGDVVSTVNAAYWMGVALSLCCRFDKARQYMDRALEINVAANNLWGISTIRSSLSGWGYFFAGNINLALQTSDEAVKMAEECGDINAKSWACLSQGMSSYGKGSLEKARMELLKGIDFCEKAELLVCNTVARNLLGEVYLAIGDPSRATVHYEKAVSITEESRAFPSWTKLNRIGLALAEGMNGKTVFDLQLLYDYVAQNKLKLYEGWMPRYISQILLRIDERHIPDAEVWIGKAIEADQRNGMMWYLARDYDFCAEVWERKGEVPRARENLIRALEIYKGCAADGWVTRVEEKLAALS